MTSNLLTKTFSHNGIDIALTFRDDGWFNMTKAAKVFDKQTKHFLELPSTREYIAALKGVAGKSDVYRATPGWHLNPDVGTWAHPKLAVFFARWLDVRFSVWCDSVIDDILHGRQAPTPAPAPVQTQAPAVGIEDCLRAMVGLTSAVTELVLIVQQLVSARHAPAMDPMALLFMPMTASELTH
jgi:hypothetical protein